MWYSTLSSTILQMGLGLAVEYALHLGMDAIWERVQFLAATLRQRLQTIPGVTLQDTGRLLCGIVSFTLVSPPDLTVSPDNQNMSVPTYVGISRICTVYAVVCFVVTFLARASVVTWFSATGG